MSSLRDDYQARIARGDLVPDPVQADTLARMDDFLQGLLTRPKQGWWDRVRRRPVQPIGASGFYLHGPVGRGKTMMMDLFMAHLPASIRHQRVHFHDFMRRVHDFFHTRRTGAGDKARPIDDLIPSFVDSVARDVDILCFDEFQVSDVADAMILSRLFTGLLDRGLVMVLTSNTTPDELYKGGLQRDRFIPFIDLIKDRLILLPVAGPNDHRLRHHDHRASRFYLYPLIPETFDEVNSVFADLTHNAYPVATRIRVQGRDIRVPAAASGVARFTFADLCEAALSAADYAALADHFHTFFIERVPALGPAQRNEARRFIHLIDVLYDRQRKLVISADVRPEQLYPEGDHADEFRRTQSRLMEMQSAQYWSR